MTTLEFNRIHVNAIPEQARGWMASVMLHLLGLAAATLVMAEIERPVPRELFQWDISMVDSPTLSESQPAEPIVQPPPSPVKPSPPVRQTKPTNVEQLLPPQEITVPVETTQMVKDVVTNAEPVMEYAAVESIDEPVVASQAVVTEPIESSDRPMIEQVPVVSTAPTFEHRLVQYRPVRHRETRADYGWLRDLLWKRIEELKRYPTLARENHWEGRVVVQAVIKADGTVGDLSVAESSGHALLDQDALVVMRKASPLTLLHQLERAQITILVPISYRLEG
jgi:periplasmic protein TonB